MRLDFRESRRALAPLALSAALFALPASLSSANDGPFLRLAGDWVGEGTISASNGNSEPIRCRVSYAVSPAGRAVDQRMRCASDSYRFDVNSSLTFNGENWLGGTWTETTRQVTGNVTGQVNGDAIAAEVTGPNFTARLNVVTRGSEQSIQIAPSGGEISQVTIQMRRSKG